MRTVLIIALLAAAVPALATVGVDVSSRVTTSTWSCLKQKCKAGGTGLRPLRAPDSDRSATTQRLRLRHCARIPVSGACRPECCCDQCVRPRPRTPARTHLAFVSQSCVIFPSPHHPGGSRTSCWVGTAQHPRLRRSLSLCTRISRRAGSPVSLNGPHPLPPPPTPA